MKAKYQLCAVLFLVFLLASCKKEDITRNPELPAAALPLTKKYSSKVATEWIALQLRLTQTTPGFGPGVTGRAFAYTGLALYESVVPGIPSYQTFVAHSGGGIFHVDKTKKYYWPASANAAMAEITRKLYAAASDDNLASIDSLEALNNTSYQPEKESYNLQASIDFGKSVASKIFEWSKTDGFMDPVTPATIPTAPGYWVPTAPLFIPAVASNWGDLRSFIPDVAEKTQPPAPTEYSSEPSSPFYAMADEVYNISQHLTADDISLVKTWADLPGNFNGQAHFTNVLTQLLIAEDASLAMAAIAYAKHGMAINDAAISCFRTKYTYFLVRPITYIRTVMGHPEWNTVIPTPPHPEYSAAHATISAASAVILASTFGHNYAFVDHTHEKLYGARTYQSFEDYAYQSGWSRVLAGVHYKRSVLEGLVQGESVGLLTDKLPLKK